MKYLRQTGFNINDKIPPIVHLTADDLKSDFGMSESSAVYFPETNIIVSVLSSSTVFNHEMMHYYSNALRQPSITIPTKLNEGVNEYFTQKLVRLGGVKMSGDVRDIGSYLPYVEMAFYLGQIVGDSSLLAAHLSGDYSGVKEKLDQSLGAGTYDKLMKRIEKTLLSTIYDYMDGQLSIDYSPIISGAKEKGIPLETFNREFWK